MVLRNLHSPFLSSCDLEPPIRSFFSPLLLISKYSKFARMLANKILVTLSREMKRSARGSTWNPTFYTGIAARNTRRRRTKEHPREYLLDASINRVPVATRARFFHRWKVRCDAWIGRSAGKRPRSWPVSPWFSLRVSVSKRVLSYSFFSPPPALSTSETFLRRGNFSRWKILFFFSLSLSLFLRFSRDGIPLWKKFFVILMYNTRSSGITRS